MNANQSKGRTFCSNCERMVRYRLDEVKQWECRGCGFAIDCTRCGSTMEARHNCGPKMAGANDE